MGCAHGPADVVLCCHPTHDNATHKRPRWICQHHHLNQSGIQQSANAALGHRSGCLHHHRSPRFGMAREKNGSKHPGCVGFCNSVSLKGSSVSRGIHGPANFNQFQILCWNHTAYNSPQRDVPSACRPIDCILYHLVLLGRTNTGSLSLISKCRWPDKEVGRPGHQLHLLGNRQRNWYVNHSTFRTTQVPYGDVETEQLTFLGPQVFLARDAPKYHVSRHFQRNMVCCCFIDKTLDRILYSSRLLRGAGVGSALLPLVPQAAERET